MQSDNPTAAILVIGDEILSGRTQDTNSHHLAGVLTSAGIDLRELRVVADDHDAIVAALRALAASLGGAWDLVFTSGGIGPTHDDITADAVADAFGVELVVNDAARDILQRRWAETGVEITPARLRMARIPVGATLIDNAVSAAPGFSLGGVHVMAGVPSVFKAMTDWLVPRLPTGRPPVSETIEVMRPESEVAGELLAVARSFPALSLGSYPFHNAQGYGTNLVIRGLDGDQVAQAKAELSRALGLPA
ncbi:competence/damage-inducible protein A [Paracoccus sp. Z118]|uniref:competence/damage-inducible protein A n=1 Tax=Paracoccus sp. Z118 TaxID=2851017 RepID=UPI001C2C18DB|nr:molybdopterin-binding protein [Paracoccus sp. Z118]MBV0891741.1 competence/damage-inducible protein A [Paracoccus sp. Z118]